MDEQDIADPVHPQARAMMERIAASGEPPLETLPPSEARRLADARVGGGLAPIDMAEVRNLSIDGPGGTIRLRLYRPASGRRPLAMFFHGGGFMVANLDTHDALCRQIAHRSGAAVLAVDYRLAPEHKFPAAPQDCLRATDWALAHADELEVDIDRFVLVGESSGGNLSAVVAQQLRDAGGAQPALQVMIYPMLDAATDSPSYARFAEGFFFTRAKSRYFIDHYLRGPEDAANVMMSPLRAENVAGLPRALIVTAGLDPMLSEAEAYAGRLRAAGVPVEYRCFEGWPHGFLFWGETDASKDAIDLVARAISTAIGAER